MFEWMLGIGIAGTVFFFVLFFALWQKVMVMDYQKAVVYADGRFEQVLEAGEHRLWMVGRAYELYDIRSAVLAVPGQEILTSDHVGIKVSAVLKFRIASPEILKRATQSYKEDVYLETQLILRDLISGTSVDDLFLKRESLSSQLYEKLAPKLAALGLSLETAGLKDIMVPGPLRQALAQVVEAKKAALASLEKARGEAAALRHLANAARMLENNPALVTLKTLQIVGDGKHTLVMGLPSHVIPLPVVETGTGKQKSEPPSPSQTEPDETA